MFQQLLVLLPGLVFSIGPAKRFYENVLKNESLYDRLFPPWDTDGRHMNVTMACYQITLASVREDSLAVDYITQINMTWKDPRLAFDPKDYGNEYSLIMPPNSVWIPRIDIYNGKNNRDIKSDAQDDVVEVRYDGSASQVSYVYLESLCSIDVSQFPFDEQWCVFGFTSATVPVEKLTIDVIPELVFTVGLPEWEILGAKSFEISYLQRDRNFSLAEVAVHLKRKPQFYIHLLILPTFIVTTICISAMLLPIDVDLGERINLGIAGLLSLTFMLSIMLSELPKSPSLPLMGKWVIAEITICCIAMLIPMALNITERRLSKRYDLRCYLKTATLCFFILVNVANALTTILLFVARDRIPDLAAYKAV